jgi:hypothetical protein
MAGENQHGYDANVLVGDQEEVRSLLQRVSDGELTEEDCLAAILHLPQSNHGVAFLALAALWSDDVEGNLVPLLAAEEENPLNVLATAAVGPAIVEQPLVLKII